jgi:N-acetylmuramoyl-L-alanine amidase
MAVTGPSTRVERRVRIAALAVTWALLPAPAWAASPAGAAPAQPPAATFVVAIDPGHGGSNLGAAGVSASVLEKRVTLALARRLRARLAEQPGIQVVLCRDEDVLVPIRARARRVEQAHAALFISLHANASPPGVTPGSRRGFELYVLSPQEVEDDAALAELRQVADVDAAWAAHQVRADAQRAAVAARIIEARMKEALGPHASRGVRQTGASLDVLRGTGAPSILLEIGFLDHPDEGAMLASAAGQERIADALTAAVVELRDH